MPDAPPRPLRLVDGLELPPEQRAVLRPGEIMLDRQGIRRRLPRWFLQVPGWEAALETNLTPRFRVWEFLNVDVREHPIQRMEWPRYVPLGIGLLAAALEVLRSTVGTFVYISTNGGYRSPAHRLSVYASPHCWGTAVNLYRIGDDFLNNKRTISRYGNLVRELNPACWARPYGYGPGETYDHLHLDLGFTVITPHGGG